MNRITIIMSVAACLALGAWTAEAGPIEDPGPHLAGWRDISFTDTIYGQGTISARLYYPALTAGQDADPDPASGPYPLVGFQHGWLQGPSSYDNLCSHIASWGFVAASTGTETGLFPSHEQFARDTRSLLAWMESLSADPASWFADMADGGDWAAAGHSMGGGALALLVGIEPRVRTIVGMQSADVNGPDLQNIRAFTGNVCQIAGSVDWIVPAGTVRTWYENAFNARRNVYYLVDGMGHTGCTDNPPGSEPLPGPEQARMHRRLVTGMLRAEVKGEEDLYADLCGEGIASEPLQCESDCANPAFWARPSVSTGGSVAAGLCGYEGGIARMAGSFGPASIQTPYGMLGLSLARGRIFYAGILDAGGWDEEIVPSKPAWSGLTAYFQGAVLDGSGGGTLTRTVVVTLP